MVTAWWQGALWQIGDRVPCDSLVTGCPATAKNFVLLVLLLLFIAFMHGIKNNIPETNHFYGIQCCSCSAVTIYATCNVIVTCWMFCTVTLALSQCVCSARYGLLSVVPSCSAVRVCRSGTVWMILRRFELPVLFTGMSFVFCIPRAPCFCFKVYILESSQFLSCSHFFFLKLQHL